MKWISTADSLPPMFEWVRVKLVADGVENIAMREPDLAPYKKTEWIWYFENRKYFGYPDSISHWRKLAVPRETHIKND